MDTGHRLFVMEPYDDAMSMACASLRGEIERCSKIPKEDQPALDKLLAEHEYHFGDISDWPNDICEISPTKTVPLEKPEIYFLGSLAACAHLGTHQAETPLISHRVSVTLSFCRAEMQRIRGQPEMGWKSWFQNLQIRWFVFDLDDPKTRLHDATSFCEDMGNAWLSCWMEMCCTLLQHLSETPKRDERGILFHCIGGVNRSSAALCAWLIFRHGLTTQEAVQSLLAARPTLCPWQHRPHVFWALHTWEKNQDHIIRPRILAEVRQMSDATPGPA